MHLCCLDEHFGLKIRELQQTPSLFLDDAKLMAGLKLWAHESRTCNMHMERLLALIRKSMGFQKSPDVERLVSAGTLTQIMKDHLLAGGSDPRFVTRQQLLDKGAPLECALEAPTKSKAASGFVSFRAERRPTLAEGEKDHLQEVVRAWADQPPLEKERYKDIALASWHDKQRRIVDARGQRSVLDSDLPASLPKKKPEVFFGLGSDSQPITLKHLKDSIRELLTLPPGDLPGHREICTSLREKLQREIMVDDDPIPTKQPVSYTEPCWRCHPGLCRKRDDWCWAEVYPLSKAITAFFAQAG